MSVVDVIVVNWNDREHLRAALDSVFALPELKDNPDFAQVVVSDNGSTDGSVAFLKEVYDSHVHVIKNGENLGFGAGCNRAIAQTNSPYIFLLNPDATVQDGAIRELVKFMETHPRAAMAGPKIFESDGSVAQSCGEFDTWTSAFLRSSAWGEWPFFRPYANGASLQGWNYDSERKVDLVIGAAVLLRRSVLQEIGPFDERFFMYHEEVDLAKRIADSGYESWFIPAAHATHIGQGSSGGKSVEGLKQRSRRKYWLKHHGPIWFYSLSAALIARYALYLAILAAAVYLSVRLLKGHP